MMKQSRLLPLRTDFRFALTLWVGITAEIITFAALATFLNVKGFSDEEAILLALALSLTLGAVVILLRRSFARVDARIDVDAEKRRNPNRLSLPQLVQRLRMTLAGVSSLDLIVDLMRITG